jgi:gliding motility-associated-like protein
VEACAGQNIKFCFDASSPDASAILTTADNSASSMPGSTVSYTGIGTNTVRGCVDWTPSPTDTGLKIFAVTVKDSTCIGPGIILSQTFVIPVYIRAAAISSRTETICIGNEVALLASGNSAVTWGVAPGGSDISTLSCTTCQEPTAKPDITTTYFAVSQNANGCSNVDSITLKVDNTNRINIAQGDTIVVCRPGIIQLKASVTGPRPLQNLSCGLTAAFPTNPVDTAVIIPSFKQIQGLDPLQPITVAAPYMGQYSTARHQYLIKAEDMKRGGMYSGTLKKLGFKMAFNNGGGALRNVKISLKCTDQNELSTANGFENGTIPVYNNPNLQTIPAGSGYYYFTFTSPYNWDTTQNLIVDFCYSNPSAQAPVGVHYTSSGYNGTLYAFNNSGNLCTSGNSPNLAITDEIPLMNFVYHPAPETDFGYAWENGVFLPNNYTDTPRVYASRSMPLYVSTRNKNGCYIRDTLNIYMPTSNLRPLDTNICETHGAVTMAFNGQTYQWYDYNGSYYPPTDLSGGFTPATQISCTDCPNPILTPTSDKVYAVIIQDHGCLDTFKAKVDVTPFPTTRILNDDTTIFHGGSVKLVATGADRYLWTPFKWLSNPQIFNPVVSPEQSTTYMVMGSAARNLSCRTYDSVNINVKYIWPILVPSAFSPNGDGRNDLFRIANLTTQKVEEFRVYNRYGREVFSGRDNSGWDGTHNGRDADIGAYHYIIRVSYADGKAKLFKGDVELIR